MRPEANKYLFDIAQAGELIARFNEGKTYADYEADVMLRAAVERQFAIIGEALAQLARLDEAVAGRISEGRRIIAFRSMQHHRCACRSPLPGLPASTGDCLLRRPGAGCAHSMTSVT